MFTRVLFLGLALGTSVSLAFGSDQYKVGIDLTKVINDRVFVSIQTPQVKESEVVVVFPVTVPGTYEEHQWYRLVHNFKAFDASGDQLTVNRSADSQFVVSNAKNLARLEYWLDDSFDDVDDRVDIFPPAGTDFEEDSIFVLNHGGIVCYVEGYQKLPYEIHIKKPGHLFGASALHVKKIDDENDVYTATSYDHLVDSPVMYSLPDTSTFEVAGVKVLVALAHRNTDKLAKEYAKTLKKVCVTVSKFLGTMPVDNYAFLIYLWNRDTVNVKGQGAKFGALEHSYSSFYFWAYSKRPFGLRDVASHEFLHILVPLNVHSEEIAKFDFRTPKMSAHLWLYEGVTEYLAQLSGVHDSSTSESGFLREMKRKLEGFNSIPKNFNFTDFSRNVLTKENQPLYPLVYTYGALNGLLMDILLRESSGGRMGLLDMVYALMKKYGPNKPFKDSDLFGDIDKIAGSEVRAYCDEYLQGSKLIPLRLLNKIGWSFQDSVSKEGLSYGVKLSYKQNGARGAGLYAEPRYYNPLQIERGDKIVKINGQPLEEIQQATWMRFSEPKEGVEMSITVERENGEVELKGVPALSMIITYNVLEENINATKEELRLRRSVFYGTPF